MFVLFLVFTLAGLVSSFASISTCSSSQLYDYISFKCVSCPTNTIITADPTFCNCTLSSGYYPNTSTIGFNHSTSCIQFVSVNQLQSSQYNIIGASSPQIIGCSSSAYLFKQNQSCQPCSRSANMVYDSVLLWCVCKTVGFFPINGFCYQQTQSFTNPFSNTTSQRDNFIAYFESQVGCIQYNLQQPCQRLINMCVKAQYSTNDPFCALLKTLNNKLFMTAPTLSIGVSASSILFTNTTTVQNQFNFVLFEYKLDGTLNAIKPLDESILPCDVTNEDYARFQSFGLNFFKFCTIKNSLSQSYYDIYVKTNISTTSLHQVPILFSNAYYKRYLPSTPFRQLQMQLVSQPPMNVPTLQVATGSDPNGKMTTSSTATSTAINSMIPLIIAVVITFIIFIYNFYKYVKYNPDENSDPYYCFKALFLFFVAMLKYVGFGLWFYLLSISCYLFTFYKLQQVIYIVIPQDSTFYGLFFIIFYLQCGLVLFAIIYNIVQLSSSTDYFLIDWEKQKNISQFDVNIGNRQNIINVSVWRKILLVNQLYQATVNSVVNIELTMIVSIFFLEGLSWIDLAAPIPNTDLSLILNPYSVNRSTVLAYFIITGITFAVAICQFVVRKALKIWFPLPEEDFVDLCSIGNISIMIFDQSLHGYYIHGMNPLGQSQGSLSYIEEVFEKEAKSFGKSRSFLSEEEIQTFEVVFPFQIRQNYQLKYKNKYLQKLAGRVINQSMLQKPIPDLLTVEDYMDVEKIHQEMVQSFKFYLEGVKTSQTHILTRNLLEKIINCPINTQLIGGLPVFLKDYWNDFTSVFLQGYQFLFIINLINFINLWYLASKSAFVGFFLGFMVHKFIIRNLAQFMVKRNISKNTMVDDKFFN